MTIRRKAIDDALDRHKTNGVIRDWFHTGPKNQHYTIMLVNGQTIQTSNLQYIDMICLGLESASQAWRRALPGQGNSPAEAIELGLSLADRLRLQAMGDAAPGSWAAIAAEHAAAFQEIAGVSPAQLHERLMDWQRQGAIEYVQASDPMGQHWIVGGRDREGTPWLLKLGHDNESAAMQVGVFVAALAQGMVWGMKTTLDRLGRPDPDLDRMFPQREPTG